MTILICASADTVRKYRRLLTRFGVMTIGELQVVHSLADKQDQKDNGLHEAKTTEGVTACPILSIDGARMGNQ